MVSFSCESCGDILTKKKLDPHRNRCHGATFTCIDCMVHFPGAQYRTHTSCMTEDQKYQGALYKDKTKKQKPNTPAKKNQSETMASNQAYVEEGDDRYDTWKDFQGQTDDERSPAEAPPEAPTPPAAVDDDQINVFDFMVATGQTPNASNLDLLRDQPAKDESKSLVRFQEDEESDFDPALLDDTDPIAKYSADTLPRQAYETPAAAKSERRKTEVKKDKKRKRLHLDIPGDQEMTDAPPVLHSGLTGGLKSLMRPTLPPSPNYSGGEVEPTVTSPTKKSKSKHHKSAQVHHSLFGMLTGTSKVKSSKKHKSPKKSSRRSKEPELIEYRPRSKEGNKTENGANQMVVYKPRPEVFFNFVSKGPESERGCSMNKALKRFHREREAAGTELSKHSEEKELWRSIRLRRNDRGEIVLFSIDDE